MPADRPDTHVQFRLPPDVALALDAEAASLGRSRAVTAKLMLIKLLAPGLHREWMNELRSHPERVRLPKT